MEDLAVTTEAPAVSTEVSPQQTLDKASGAELKAWRLTGELPKPKAVTADPAPAIEEPSVGDEPKTAAAPVAAQPRKKDAEARLQELLGERKRERDEMAAMRTRLEAFEKPAQQSQVKPAAPPTAPVEPKMSDFATMGEYMTAARKYDKETLLAEAKAEWSKGQQLSKQQEADQVIERTVNERYQKATEKYPDYQQVWDAASKLKDGFGRDAIYFDKGSHLDRFFLKSDQSHDLFYEIAKNPDDYMQIFARDAQGKYVMDAVDQLRELAKAEFSLESPTIPSVRRVPNLPAPPTTLNARSTTVKDEAAHALAKGDFRAFYNAENNREIRARKG